MSDQTKLPSDGPARWIFVILAAVCAGLGVWSSTVTLAFFDEGSRLMEPSSTGQGVVRAAALLLVVLEMAAFGIAALLPGRIWRAQRRSLAGFALAILAFECVTITVVQHGVVVGAERAAIAGDSRARELRASIAVKRESAAQRRAAAAVAAQSAILASRLSAAASFAAADELEARAESLGAELAQLEVSRPAPVSQLLGDGGTLAYAVVRGLLVSAGGLIMFGAAGALLRVARSGNPSGIGAEAEQGGASSVAPGMVRMEAQRPFAPSAAPSAAPATPAAPAAPAGCPELAMVHAAPDPLPAPNAVAPRQGTRCTTTSAPFRSSPPRRTSAIGKAVLGHLEAGPKRKADLVRQFAGVHTRGAVYRAVATLVEDGQVIVNGDILALVRQACSAGHMEPAAAAVHP